MTAGTENKNHSARPSISSEVKVQVGVGFRLGFRCSVQLPTNWVLGAAVMADGGGSLPPMDGDLGSWLQVFGVGDKSMGNI